MKPALLYVSPRAAVYCGDSSEALPQWQTESFDLVVTDPPYGVSWQSNLRKESFAPIHGDGPEGRDLVRSILTECVRLTAQNRHLYVFGPTDALEGLKVSEATALVWDKGIMGAGDLASAWGPAHEEISFVVNKHRHAGQSGKPALAVRLRKGTVLHYGRATGRKVRHPSEKPVELLAELIESSSRIGETVLDPFAGVGSTGVAALLRGRKVVLVEIDEGYAAQAVERLCEAEELYLSGARV